MDVAPDDPGYVDPTTFDFSSMLGS